MTPPRRTSRPRPDDSPPAAPAGPPPSLFWLLATASACVATAQFLGPEPPTASRIALVALAALLFVFCATRAVAVGRQRRATRFDDPQEDR